MRIWDQVPPSDLCSKHLGAQWFEGLGLWAILTQGKTGYANHPETKRWSGFERQLWTLLFYTRSEMVRRGWRPKAMPDIPPLQPIRPNPPPWDDQLARLRSKGCPCKVPA